MRVPKRNPSGDLSKAATGIHNPENTQARNSQHRPDTADSKKADPRAVATPDSDSKLFARTEAVKGDQQYVETEAKLFKKQEEGKGLQPSAEPRFSKPADLGAKPPTQKQSRFEEPPAQASRPAGSGEARKRDVAADLNLTTEKKHLMDDALERNPKQQTSSPLSPADLDLYDN